MFACILSALVTCSTSDSAPLLDTARAIRELSPEQVARNLPVKLTAVVTHANPHIGDFFLQDRTAGIYVHPIQAGKELTAGDHVEVIGVSHPGAFAPCIQASAIR